VGKEKTMDVSKHVREHRSLLARIERRTLISIARRLPEWVTSDLLTGLGLAAMLGAGLAYWAGRWNRWMVLLVPVALAVNWFGDSLDGTVARVRNRQRPRYGFYVDHVLDVIGLLFLLGGLALSGFMTPLVAVGLFAAYVMVAAEVFLSTCVQGVFRLAAFGFGPTELRIVLGIGTLFLLRSPVCNVPGVGRYLLFDVGGIVAIAGMGAAFLFSAVQNTRALYRAEPLPGVSR
jgi:phosphatidylglycerophosphate synthase